MKRKFAYASILLLVVILLSEVAVRLLGMVDFPLYEANAEIGYIPAASQSGRFLNRNAWQFNSLHMGARDFSPSENPDWLLVGDSIVAGGNPLAENERLGPSIEALLQGQHVAVWPISAGSWALRNELIWLSDHPEVLARVDLVVFVLNSGDFGEASSWSCELTHPRRRPFSALWYLVNKYVYTFEPCGGVPRQLQVPAGNLQKELAAYLAAYRDKTLFVLYPDFKEELDPALFEKTFAVGRELLTSAGAQVVSVAGHPAWKTSLYRDDIHPTAEGDKVLAGILAELIANKTAPSTQEVGSERK